MIHNFLNFQLFLCYLMLNLNILILLICGDFQFFLFDYFIITKFLNVSIKYPNFQFSLFIINEGQFLLN